MSAEELEGIDRVREELQGELGRQLGDLLTAEEIVSLAAQAAGGALPGGFQLRA